MTKRPSYYKKSPIRKFDSRSICKGKSYTVKDIAKIYNINESVIHRWKREEGLIAVDNGKPAMFHWQTLKQFLNHKNKSRKMPEGNAGDFPCFSCKMKRRAFKDQIIITKKNDKLWNAKAVCCVCGTKMNMGIPASDFTITMTWGYEVVQELPKFSIIESKNAPSTTSRKDHELKPKFQPEKVQLCAENERIKHEYFDKVITRFGKSEKTLRTIVNAILAFEEFNNYENFKLFKYEIAKGFKNHLLAKYQHSPKSAHRITQAVQEFFIWLKDKTGYKTLDIDDIYSLRLSLKDAEKAKSSRSKPRKKIAIEQWEEMVLNIKPQDEKELRGRAIFACLLLSGIRIDALLSLQLGDLNLEENYIFQDATHVNTKFSSSHKTNLWGFKPEIKQILVDWVKLLKEAHHFTSENPLFPKIQITTNDQFQFEKDGFKKEFIKQPDVIRKELAKQFENTNIEYCTPHTIRNSLTSMFMGFDLSAEQIKAVSQNLSHKNLETTMNSYYDLNEFKQDQIIASLDIEQLKKSKAVKDNPKYQYILSQLISDNPDIIDKVFNLVAKESK